jgi:hypothetical protein
MTQLALPGLGKIEESEFVDFHEGVPSQNASKYFDVLGAKKPVVFYCDGKTDFYHLIMPFYC